MDPSLSLIRDLIIETAGKKSATSVDAIRNLIRMALDEAALGPTRAYDHRIDTRDRRYRSPGVSTDHRRTQRRDPAQRRASSRGGRREKDPWAAEQDRLAAAAPTRSLPKLPASAYPEYDPAWAASQRAREKAIYGMDTPPTPKEWQQMLARDVAKASPAVGAIAELSLLGLEDRDVYALEEFFALNPDMLVKRVPIDDRVATLMAFKVPSTNRPLFAQELEARDFLKKYAKPGITRENIGLDKVINEVINEMVEYIS